MVVTTRHLFTIPGFSKRAGFCRHGARRWAASRGIDWGDFVRHGIDAERLTATGDAFALALVAWAKQCADKELKHG